MNDHYTGGLGLYEHNHAEALRLDMAGQDCEIVGLFLPPCRFKAREHALVSSGCPALDGKWIASTVCSGTGTRLYYELPSKEDRNTRRCFFVELNRLLAINVSHFLV